MISLVFDTETTSKCDFKAPHTSPYQPDIIQIAWILGDEHNIIEEFQTLVNPTDANPQWQMDPGAEAVHGISRQEVLENGRPTKEVMVQFSAALHQADVLVCHNTQFDFKLVATALHRVNGGKTLERLQNSNRYCTMLKSTRLCNLPGPYGPKWPKLLELYPFLFNGEQFDGAHEALSDVRATRRCYYEMVRRGII